jgi:hypothetical protein
MAHLSLWPSVRIEMVVHNVTSVTINRTKRFAKISPRCCDCLGALCRAPATLERVGGDGLQSALSHVVSRTQETQMAGAKNAPNGTLLVKETGRLKTYCRTT